MKLIQHFTLLLPGGVNKTLIEFPGYPELQQYMFSLYRMRALSRLLDDLPSASEVMSFMVNTKVHWDDFLKSSLRLSTQDIVDLIEAFENANYTKHEDIRDFIRGLVDKRPTGILRYSQTLDAYN